MNRRPSIPFEAIGLHARLRAQPLRAIPEPIRTTTMAKDDPKNPTQVPPGDLSDAVKDNTLPGDFEDGEDDEENDDED